MSTGKFASITSSLLARKGEATPWAQGGQPTLAWRAEPPEPAPQFIKPPPAMARATAPPPPPATLKRCSVRLYQADYERLGLMAVKKDVTRQQLLQTALGEVLANMAREFPRSCSCIGEGCGKACGEKDTG
jgi:hypothetical protein